ncbi:hypothetical protein [Actinophytocola sp.]|uniref:hypothetical protein n=1 Tax=Actinophytocola sp. TaxID=1872138 RepID=UPI002ED1A1C6
MLEAFIELDPTWRLVVVGLVLIAAYGVGVRMFPYRACPYCSGGNNYSPTGKHFNVCSRCGGSRRKLRLMARVFGHRDR